MDTKYYQSLVEMCDEGLESLSAYESRRKTVDWASLKAPGAALLDHGELQAEIRAHMPVKAQYPLKVAANKLATLGSISGATDNAAIRSALQKIRSACAEMASRPTPEQRQRNTVFYSWQSKHPKTNRAFIRDCLEKATKQIGRELNLEEPIRIDSDTSDVPGSPDIIHTILDKIDSAAVFVADVSLVTSNCPNANVMLELGYAIKALGGNRIVMVFNEAFGNTRDLPFDLGFKRQQLYTLAEDTLDKTAARPDLTSKLNLAIKTILSSAEADE